MKTVQSSDESLRKRVEAVLNMAVSTVSSLDEAFTSGIPLDSEEQPAIQIEKETSIPQDGSGPSNENDNVATVAETSELAGKENAGKEVEDPTAGNSSKGDEEMPAAGEESEEDDAELQVHA